MSRRLASLVLFATLLAHPATAQQQPLDYIYSADTLVERAEDYACQLALSGQIAADEGFLLSSSTYVRKAGGFGVALALRLRRQKDGQVVDVPVTGLTIDAAGVPADAFAVRVLPGGFGLISRDDRGVFRNWGPALSGSAFTLTIARGDGRGPVSVLMPPLPEDLAARHRRCLERLGG